MRDGNIKLTHLRGFVFNVKIDSNMISEEDYYKNKKELSKNIKISKGADKAKAIDAMMFLHLDAYESGLIDAEIFGYQITGQILDCNEKEIPVDKYNYYNDEI